MHKFFIITLLSMVSAISKGQNNQPKGYESGSVILLNNEVKQGFVKLDINASASIYFIDSFTKSKQLYKGEELKNVYLQKDSFICIKGDFFKLIVAGELSFLQKKSNAASIPTYIGTEAVFVNGAIGSIGDYFLYHSITNQLVEVNKKNVNKLALVFFKNNEPAIVKAKEGGKDITSLQYAVTIFNNQNN